LSRIAPPHTVRGAVKGWIARHAARLAGPVLEIGSAGSTAWWVDNRGLRPELPWVGVDMRRGDGVDVVGDGYGLPFRAATFGGVLCSEVLEHVWQPPRMLAELRRVMQPGAVLLVTTLWAFPYHAYPDDYWRFSRSALARLLAEVGFGGVATDSAGEVSIPLDDHGNNPVVKAMERQVFAVGVAA